MRLGSMSREIKFRVWDSVNAEMTTPNETLDILISMDNKVFALMKEDNCSLGEIVRENTIIMQFTGLLDLNGTEIYEGDLVTGYIEHSGGYLRKNFPRRVKVICEVVFDRGMFQTVIKKPIQEHRYAYENGDYRTDYYSLRPQFKNASYYRPSDGRRVTGDGKTCEYIEIIGSIYENKGLLEEVD